MDIPREPRRKRRPYVYGGAVVAVVVVATWALGRLEPAAPSVDRGITYMDTVRRGTMVREVRAMGTLVPEQIRWVPAVTAGRVERKLVQPGARVEARTVLLELSNPEVQLELLEAERQLSSAQAQLVNLRTTLETQRLNQAGVVATVRAEHLDAQRNAEAADELVRRDSALLPRVELLRLRDRAEELVTRLRIEQERLQIFAGAIDSQLAVQRGQIERLTDIVAFHRRRVASMRVLAGTDGVLQDMEVEEGQWVLPGFTLARVVKPERLMAELQVPQVQARDVVIGQSVLVDTRRDTIPGRVIRVDPAVQGGYVVVDVGLEAELPPGARPDLAVEGTIEIERLDDVLYVGRPTFGQPHSMVGMFRMIPGSNHAERVSVRIGSSSVSTVQIVAGLAVGDVVILSDMSQWDEYDRVRIR
ncbi:MAG: HlyD family efflux transporter periplasmic adaptor subunit [Gemmatimonadales bacterium]|nr:HlyD family efflux transporter periplasmic adaptor subunit [Gemmatimonadales bacterium]NIN09833.1 HlyD family efflux transporter periplasmic adaptor subunit [Gemmatimonadales bacterium]NIN48536.1 HlyD family efflux transporter periplasmic adaptor subunit [Gemmatimonadales bacterium]NIP06000.1 HlyD family efflux transporter periplasmic adaptor subunit [Gemmatimonadales bacterium]NIR01150.1 HlyD family efflux transporter periplasmic adaptor subunit [Gemmatimonadales bacterium]